MTKQSPLQKVCMQYGLDCRKLSNSYTLSQFLRKNNEKELADQVEHGMRQARAIARANYFRNRKALQPEWKDWDQQREEILNANPW